MLKTSQIKVAFITSSSIITGEADGIRAYNQLIKWSKAVGKRNIDLFIISDSRNQFTKQQLPFKAFVKNIIFISTRKGILGYFHRLFILKQEIWQKIKDEYNVILNIDIPFAFSNISLSNRSVRVFDIHGIVEEESLLNPFPKNILASKILGGELKKSLLNSDILIASSKSLIDYYKHKYSLSFDKEFVVYNYSGCCFELTKEEILKNRRQVRKSLGIFDDSPLLVYSGGVQKWQSLSLIFKTVRKLIKINPNIQWLVLTSKPDFFEYRFKKEIGDILKIHIMKVRYEEIPKYLCSADLGLVIRENNLVNNVSTPTKFGEYLACGVPVLITENLKEYAGFVLQNNLGFVINNKHLPQELISFLKHYNPRLFLNFIDRNISFVRQKFNWDIYREKVITSILEYAAHKISKK